MKSFFKKLKDVDFARKLFVELVGDMLILVFALFLGFVTKTFFM